MDDAIRSIMKTEDGNELVHISDDPKASFTIVSAGAVAADPVSGSGGAAAGVPGHCGFVFALALCGDYLCSGGGDSLIMVRASSCDDLVLDSAFIFSAFYSRLTFLLHVALVASLLACTRGRYGTSAATAGARAATATATATITTTWWTRTAA